MDVIEMTAGQEVVLAGEDEQTLTTLRMGLGWDKERTAGAIGTGAPDVDLDASAVQFSGDQLFDLAFYNNLSTRDGSVVHLGDNQTGSGEGDDEQITVDLAFYNNLSTRDGSVVHLGDNQTGSGEGDDEQITVDLSKIYAKVDTIVFLVSSYQGHTLEWIDSAYVRLVDVAGDEERELARFTLTGGVHTTGMVMATMVRDGDQWRLRAVGQGIAAKIPTESVDALRAFV